MITIIKNFVAVIMSFLNIFASPFLGDFTAPFEPLEPADCKLNMAVISDIHMTDELYRSLTLEFGLTDMQNSLYPIDALVATGDLTDHGELQEWEMLKNTFAKYSPAKNIILAQGNHDTWTEDDGYNLAKDYFIKYNNEITGNETEHEYYSEKINGYTFIVLASEDDRTSMYMSEEQLIWLEEEMEKASEGNLPIFVVSHWPLNQSHGLPETWGDDEPEPDDGGIGDQSARVEEILKKYDNVFMLSGHIHNGFVKEGQEAVYGYNTVESDGSFHSINLSQFMYPTIRGRVANGTGLMIEVYDNRVVIRPRSFTAGVWYTDYNVTIPLA
ncbi:MAG: metallophosphoesterase [Clostridia bacterium]|nr:metallophosphoesterase [Clostridia bacterium]